MVSCEIVTGLTRTPLVSAYLPLLTLEHLPDLEKDLQCFRDPIVLRDLNVELDKARSRQSQRVADLLVGYGLIDLVRHFRQRRRVRNLKTWFQVWQGTVFRSRCNYILGTDWRRFELVGIRDMRNFSLDHFALRARLLRRPTRCHTRYLQGRREFPLKLPPTAELSRAGAKFQTLQTLKPVPPKLEGPPRPLWMSPDSIRLIDKRAALRRNPRHSRNVARGLTRSVCRSLMADSRRRAEEAATEIGVCLEPSTGGADPHRAYTILKRWYRYASAWAPNPCPTDMEKVRGDFQTLYQREESQPPGLPLETHVDPAKVNDEIP